MGGSACAGAATIVDPLLERLFPNLVSEGYAITSPRAPEYNCIAWAAGDETRWWWPDPDNYWPPDVVREETVSAFVDAFRSCGYEPCPDGQPEVGVDKVAIYVDPADGVPTHAARLLPDGVWTSKCGKLQDIRHGLQGLEGEYYGTVRIYLKRTRE
jgi:hypothetical protein